MGKSEQEMFKEMLDNTSNSIKDVGLHIGNMFKDLAKRVERMQT